MGMWGNKKKYWRLVTQYISQITSTLIPLNPKLCVLGVYPASCSLANKEKKMVDLCLLQARRSIALCWKNINRPTLCFWLRNLTSSLALERLIYFIRKKTSEFKSHLGKILRLC